MERERFDKEYMNDNRSNFWLMGIIIIMSNYILPDSTLANASFLST